MKSTVFETSLQSTHSILIPTEIAEPFISQNHKRVVVRIQFQNASVRFHAALQKRKELFFVMFSKKIKNNLVYFQVIIFRFNCLKILQNMV
ncbi:hypothetical protein [Aquimarina rubra]|uniref:Uncharacterized protein n=1 Tax=Aquimarina rubra TaxID=1920033 RepID=A0ABW5LBE1_9FLAO